MDYQKGSQHKGHHESTVTLNKEDHGNKPNPLVQLDPGLFIWTIITFLILLSVLAKFAWKPLLEILDERQKSIEDSLDAAEKARQELENINKESDAILSKAKTEAQSIVADAKSAGDNMREEIMSKSKEEASQQLENAKTQIDAEKNKALTEIRKEVVDLSVSVAEKIIRKNISKEDNKSIIDESLKKIENYEA